MEKCSSRLGILFCDREIINIDILKGNEAKLKYSISARKIPDL